MQRSEENYLECGNVPDPSGDFHEHGEMEFEEGRRAPSPSSEMLLWDPQDSDCLPSVTLAVVLAIVFVLVSWFLLPCDKGGHVLLQDCWASRSNKSCPPVTCLRSLRLLFPNQPETTWRVLQQHIRGPPHRRHVDGAWILPMIGRGDSRNTVLCFLKGIISLVTDGGAIGIRFLEGSGAWLPWADFLGNGTSAIATTEIYVGPSRVPYGMMVSLWRLTSGNQLGALLSLAWVLNVEEAAREEFLLHGLTPEAVSDFLSRVPDEPMAQRNVPMILVRPEWHLEGGFLC